jgi:GNAT superfamily N-acetyltransferase
LTFQWEPFHAISREILPLWKRHWCEVAMDRDTVSLDPDWDFYHETSLRGILHILTARINTYEEIPASPLVGYVFNLVGPHNHYATTCFGITEMFWLDPAFRRGWLPVRFMQENLDGLKERGVQIATINFKLGFQDGRVGKLLARLGYEPADIVMRKRL